MPTRRTLPSPPRLPSLSAHEACALALRAQGFGDDHLREPIHILDHLGCIQLDSVNVLARSHDLVPFARLGPTPPAAMHDAIYRQRRGFEYWGHAASWLPIEEYRFFLPRMAHLREQWPAERAASSGVYAEILARIRAEGPLGSVDFDESRPARGAWSDGDTPAKIALDNPGGTGVYPMAARESRKPAKIALEHLFAHGALLCASRTPGFARLYDLPERVLPGGLDTTDPGAEAAARHLLRRAIAALGVATAREAAFYFRLRPDEWRRALRGLIDDGQVVEVAVEGWPAPGVVVPDALTGPLDVPSHRPTFLSPFDNLVWHRDRVERLFGFRYRIEIYVPEPRRQYGYYVLPLLTRGNLGGRADLKLDRSNGILRVRGLWLEGAMPEEAASALRDLAAHLGAREIQIERTEPDEATEVRRALVH